ncbi:hypothetical protein ColTof4_02631 [Colletotrichum tofieldiae]|uniref:Uncharacterized protein n=1 Tax=Colletotrichum tofieldiae TaxID=708197 RepID=A0A166UZT3_9PEZI|nr:hypothetical protein CT0861_00155 [Colletotrichum tofieldiae]GKT61738.1 hypothetical protein ColTof3_09077 [Colletotrichum tofieldiae]GKT70208.1 hypothetical protein ColTof4_02631 [Colletotrichum tofieldiae]GKT93258.1 hypothetical protein Ct61P_11108 [Colletotrichum tofieldiae]
MDIPQPVLKVVAVALSVGILVELAIVAKIACRSHEKQMDWDPDTGRFNTNDGNEEYQPQRDNRMPPVDHTL